MRSIAAIQRAVFFLELTAAALLAVWLRASFELTLLLAAALGLLLPLLMHTLVIGSSFVVSSYALRITNHPRPQQFAVSWTTYFACVAQEVLISLRNFSWAQPWLSHLPLAGQTRTNSSPIPVLLLHGYFCNRGLWRTFARKLDGAGHAVSAISMEPVFGSIDDYAASIADAVRALRQRTGVAQIALVCHSMGGLAARAYLRRYGDAAVAHVVTLGTPHHGTFSAQHGLGENALQMRLASPWRDALMGESGEQLYTKFTVILTHHDNIVAPQSIQSLPGARLIELAALGHMALVYDPKVQGIVCDVLAGVQAYADHAASGMSASAQMAS